MMTSERLTATRRGDVVKSSRSRLDFHCGDTLASNTAPGGTGTDTADMEGAEGADTAVRARPRGSGWHRSRLVAPVVPSSPVAASS